MMDLTQFANKIMIEATPFVEKGRDYDGIDCWGLVYLCYRDVYGIELPTHTGDYNSTRRRQEVRDLIAQRKDAQWVLTKDPRPGDGVLLRQMGRACHMGVLMDRRNVLHIEEGTNASIEDITKLPWRGANFDKVEGIYRHVGRL